jgi:putative flippase GtrA
MTTSTTVLEGKTETAPRNSAGRSIFRRGCAFYTVGFLGIGIQLLTLAALQGQLGLHFLPATALAVEAAVMHNFLWHERWTWADRPAGRGQRLRRLWLFHLSSGVLSLVGNLLLMSILVGRLGMPALPANLSAIGACSMLNFLVSHRWVFAPATSTVELVSVAKRNCLAGGR